MSFITRIITSYIFIAISCLLFFSSQKAMSNNSLDDHIFFSCETQGSISKKLSKGYRAFIILPDSPVIDILNDVDYFLSKDDQSLITLIFKEEFNHLNDQLNQHRIKKYLAIPGKDNFENLPACRKTGKRLFIFAPGQSSFYFASESYICNYSIPKEFPSKVESGFTGNQANDFVIFKMDSSIESLPDSISAKPYLVPELFNSYTGKLPNFFVTNRLDIFLHFKEYMEHYNWYTANVIYNEKPLSGVSWEGIPELTSSGKIHVRRERLSPQKSGYRFSPDIFQFNKLTSKETKIFYATPKHLTSELVLSLNFDKHIKNSVIGTDETPYSNLEFVKDPSKGWCGLFNGKGHYIDFDTAIELENNITISVWVNPANIKNNHSILGKGEAFSVKFRDGMLLFTAPGIKDHFSDSTIVKENEWQHLAFVFSAGNKVRFFKNGLFLGEKNASEYKPTDQSLLIGTNLWDEYFEGMMDDLSIWNRALSDEEIAKAYNQGLNQSNKLGRYLAIGILFLLVLVIMIRLKLSSQKKNNTTVLGDQNQSPITAPLPPVERPKLKGPAIEIFGGFHLINREGKDLTPRFSTRRKQLFILVLIATFRDHGISSKQLTNKLWEGYSAESAKNNRSTQIQRLREIFSQDTGISIDYKDKKWVITLHEDVFCDIERYFTLIYQIKKADKENFNSELLIQLLEIIEKGAVLPHMEDEWLDVFKSKISDELLDLLLPLYQNNHFMTNHQLVVRMSDALFIFDPLNETVLKHKVNKLFQIGKKTLANECLEHFNKYYQQCYNQPFETTLSDLLDQKH